MLYSSVQTTGGRRDGGRERAASARSSAEKAPAGAIAAQVARSSAGSVGRLSVDERLEPRVAREAERRAGAGRGSGC